jgi:hypothetical protein
MLHDVLKKKPENCCSSMVMDLKNLPDNSWGSVPDSK